MTEEAVRAFWQERPCGNHIVGGLEKRFHHDNARFFDEYDAWPFDQERHILPCLDAVDWRNRDVLEIGLGQGAESVQLIHRGVRWSGLDLTRESVDRASTRLRIRSLPYTALKRGSALEIPYGDDSFDYVFSHGVLHHIPDIRRVQAEIHRVLRPSGVLVAMLYAHHSLNYQVSIPIVRRGVLAAAYPLRKRRLVPGTGMLRDHVDNAERIGLGRCANGHVHAPQHRRAHSTLRPGVLPARGRADFPDFELERTYQRYMHAPPLPVHRWPGAERLGWHLWVHLARPGKPRPTSGDDRATGADEAIGTYGGQR